MDGLLRALSNRLEEWLKRRDVDDSSPSGPDAESRLVAERADDAAPIPIRLAGGSLSLDLGNRDKQEQLLFLYDQLRKEIIHNDTLSLQILGATLLLTGTIITIAFSADIGTDEWARVILLIFAQLAIIQGLSQRVERAHSTFVISSYLRLFVEPHLEMVKWENRVPRRPQTPSPKFLIDRIQDVSGIEDKGSLQYRLRSELFAGVSGDRWAFLAAMFATTALLVRVLATPIWEIFSPCTWWSIILVLILELVFFVAINVPGWYFCYRKLRQFAWYVDPDRIDRTWTSR